ncbi:MAG: 16S rRNA (cytosine(967)-C(5))-methyltransferase RsmB [Lachnospiraceae bacterium]|nr:16S rRNA (cytosine(967)-C(5))-methyltransferase RsmB [Lachnospiraceae bacterium]
MNSREIILDMLLELEKTDAYVNLLLADVLDKYDYLDSKEKAFIKRVTEGTVERRIQIDYILDGISKVPVVKMKPLIRALLRSGTYQILFMDAVPDAAVCNESVCIAKKRKFVSLQGYVNGVLRNIARQKQAISYPDRKKEPVAYMSVMYSMPEWLIKRFLRSYDMDTVEKMLLAFLKSAPVTLRMEESLTLETRDNLFAEWEKMGVKVSQHPYLPYAVQIEKAEGLKRLPGYDEGFFAVQDVSSMLVVEAADIKEGQTVIDLCASPGGKSLHAASKLAGTGRVYSFDLTEQKVKRMEENRLRMSKENMITAARDARVYQKELCKLADVVIADVPCSGLGVIGKKQDIKYHVSEQSLKDIVALQKEIIKNAVAYVKEGGVLMYSTCTVNPEENEKMAEWICEEFSFEPESMSAYLPEQLKESGDSGMLQLLPGIHETDGFFLAKLRCKIGKV